MADSVLGCDPRHVDRVNETMDQSLVGHNHAKTAIDVACWDLFGKATDMPVYDLLGGSTNTSMPLISSIHAGSFCSRRGATERGKHRNRWGGGSVVEIGAPVVLAVLVWDLHTSNAEMVSLMKFVWGLTTLFSGPIAFSVYWYSGRSQISHDSFWRGGWRSTAHCFSGCGIGEVVGIVLFSTVLAFTGTIGLAIGTFVLAYLGGIVLNVGPLLREGVGFREAIMDTFYSEIASITVMEIAAIGTDLLIAGDAGITELLFWTGMVLSLTVGFLVSFPMNVVLVSRGIKGGMQDPTERRQAG
jgi:hypothetical protein